MYSFEAKLKVDSRIGNLPESKRMQSEIILPFLSSGLDFVSSVNGVLCIGSN